MCVHTVDQQCKCLFQAVQISRASPAWQDYVQCVSELVLEGLKKSVLVSLQGMMEQVNWKTTVRNSIKLFSIYIRRTKVFVRLPNVKLLAVLARQFDGHCATRQLWNVPFAKATQRLFCCCIVIVGEILIYMLYPYFW